MPAVAVDGSTPPLRPIVKAKSSLLSKIDERGERNFDPFATNDTVILDMKAGMETLLGMHNPPELLSLCGALSLEGGGGLTVADKRAAVMQYIRDGKRQAEKRFVEVVGLVWEGLLYEYLRAVGCPLKMDKDPRAYTLRYWRRSVLDPMAVQPFVPYYLERRVAPRRDPSKVELDPDIAAIRAQIVSAEGAVKQAEKLMRSENDYRHVISYLSISRDLHVATTQSVEYLTSEVEVLRARLDHALDTVAIMEEQGIELESKYESVVSVLTHSAAHSDGLEHALYSLLSRAHAAERSMIEASRQVAKCMEDGPLPPPPVSTMNSDNDSYTKEVSADGSSSNKERKAHGSRSVRFSGSDNNNQVPLVDDLDLNGYVDSYVEEHSNDSGGNTAHTSNIENMTYNAGASTNQYEENDHSDNEYENNDTDKDSGGSRSPPTGPEENSSVTGFGMDDVFSLESYLGKTDSQLGLERAEEEARWKVSPETQASIIEAVNQHAWPWLPKVLSEEDKARSISTLLEIIKNKHAETVKRFKAEVARQTKLKEEAMAESEALAAQLGTSEYMRIQAQSSAETWEVRHADATSAGAEQLNQLRAALTDARKAAEQALEWRTSATEGAYPLLQNLLMRFDEELETLGLKLASHLDLAGERTAYLLEIKAMYRADLESRAAEILANERDAAAAKKKGKGKKVAARGRSPARKKGTTGGSKSPARGKSNKSASPPPKGKNNKKGGSASPKPKSKEKGKSGARSTSPKSPAARSTSPPKSPKSSSKSPKSSKTKSKKK